MEFCTLSNYRKDKIERLLKEGSYSATGLCLSWQAPVRGICSLWYIFFALGQGDKTGHRAAPTALRRTSWTWSGTFCSNFCLHFIVCSHKLGLPRWLSGKESAC